MTRGTDAGVVTGVGATRAARGGIAAALGQPWGSPQLLLPEMDMDSHKSF